MIFEARDGAERGISPTVAGYFSAELARSVCRLSRGCEPGMRLSRPVVIP
jgi:hypothetical protein